MQGEHLNIVCQVKSVYYSLGKQTSELKKKKEGGLKQLIFVFPGTFDLILQRRSHRTWLPSSPGRSLPSCVCKMLHLRCVGELPGAGGVLMPREEPLFGGDQDEPRRLLSFELVGDYRHQQLHRGPRSKGLRKQEVSCSSELSVPKEARGQKLPS